MASRRATFERRRRGARAGRVDGGGVRAVREPRDADDARRDARVRVGREDGDGGDRGRTLGLREVRGARGRAGTRRRRVDDGGVRSEGRVGSVEVDAGARRGVGRVDVLERVLQRPFARFNLGERKRLSLGHAGGHGEREEGIHRMFDVRARSRRADAARRGHEASD